MCANIHVHGSEHAHLEHIKTVKLDVKGKIFLIMSVYFYH